MVVRRTNCRSMSGACLGLIFMQLLVCLVLPAAANMAAATPGGHHHHHEKYRRITLYLVDLYTITDYMVVEGVPATGRLKPTPAPFGSIFAFHDPVYLFFDPSSSDQHHGLVGAAMGTFTTVSMDGFTFLCLLTFSFDSSATSPGLFPFNGTLSVHGLSSVAHPPLVSASIVGGTGSFLFAQGSATLTRVGTPGYNLTIQVELDVYWPPKHSSTHV